MKTKILVAVLAACGLIVGVGCEKKDEGGGDKPGASGDSKASGAAKVCEDYFAMNKKCIDKAIAGIPDQAMKDSTKKTMEDAEKQWRDMLKDPAIGPDSPDGIDQASAMVVTRRRRFCSSTQTRT